MGNYPSIGSRGGTVIGALELNLCGGGPCAMCKCCGKWNNCCADTFCPCCPGVTSPKGPEWEAAKEGFAPFMEEAATVAYEKAIRCGCCNDVMMAKQLLDADWTSRANAYLAQVCLARPPTAATHTRRLLSTPPFDSRARCSARPLSRGLRILHERRQEHDPASCDAVQQDGVNKALLMRDVAHTDTPLPPSPSCLHRHRFALPTRCA